MLMHLIIILMQLVMMVHVAIFKVVLMSTHQTMILRLASTTGHAHTQTRDVQEDAINYDPNATEDDGSCIILGCIDEFATNFNPDATNDDGSCEYSTEFFYGNWDILTLEYSTEIDLSGIPTVGAFLGTQEIDGEANNAGSRVFLNDNSFENNISFQTEPINIATFEVPGIPIDFSSSGTWEIQNDNILVVVDNTTSTISNYDILSTKRCSFLSGTIPFFKR